MYNMYKVIENWKCTKWPQTEFEHLKVKSTVYIVTHEVQILVCVILQLAIVELLIKLPHWIVSVSRPW